MGFIGAGKVAHHYKKLIQSEQIVGCDVVGIVDHDDKTAATLAGELGCESFKSSSEMIELTQPDLVLILTPTGAHYADAKYALNNGCHVVIEKPATLRIEESNELIDISAKNKRLAVVAFQNRFNPAVRLLKNSIAAGDFGKLISISVRLIWSRPQAYYDEPWRGTWALDGGVTSQQAIHHVDALNWIFGPVEKVCSLTANRVNQLEAEDTMVSILALSSGALATLEVTTGARPRDFEASISVTGELGLAEVGGVALNEVIAWEIEGGERLEDMAREYSREFENGFGTGHIHLLQSTVDTIATGGVEPVVSLRSGTDTLKLIHAIYTSDEESRWVALSEAPNSCRLGVA